MYVRNDELVSDVQGVKEQGAEAVHNSLSLEDIEGLSHMGGRNELCAGYLPDEVADETCQDAVIGRVNLLEPALKHFEFLNPCSKVLEPDL